MDALIFEAPELKTDNEIKSLSDAVVKMTQDMRDYVADIVSAEGKAADMHKKATLDALTGVNNKTAYAYDDEVRKIDAQIREGFTDVGLAIVDLNDLKYINDTYGHDRGNDSIKILCRLICEIFSRSDVYRIGGDEFAIILRGKDPDNYEQMREGLEEEIGVLADDEKLEPWERVTAAIGAAFYVRETDECFNDVFRRADYKMYTRKKEMKSRLSK